MIIYRYGPAHYIKRHRNPQTKYWEAWQLTYPNQPHNQGRCIATARLSHHLMRKIGKHHEKEQAKTKKRQD